MKYGVQLFSLRKYLKDEKGYREVFRRVKEMGAETVQLSGGKEIGAEKIAALSQEFSLPVCVTHDKFDRLKNDLDGVIAEHRIYGCPYLGIGMMPNEFRTGEAEDLYRFIDFLNTTAERLEKEGMTIAYHNHWFEFDRIDGRMIYDEMIRNTEKVEFIPDTYWMKFAGQSVEEYLAKLRGRVRTLHFKDYKKTCGLPLFRAVGKGTLDFKKILAVAEDCGVENVVAELDFSFRPYRSMEYSMNTVKELFNK